MFRNHHSVKQIFQDAKTHLTRIHFKNYFLPLCFTYLIKKYNDFQIVNVNRFDLLV